MNVRHYVGWLTLLAIAACTNGGVATSSGGAGAGTAIDIDLTLFQPTKTPYGESG
jgi:hypothetical protein